MANENDNITIIYSFNESGVSTLPVESAADNVLATRIQNELIREEGSSENRKPGQLPGLVQ